MSVVLLPHLTAESAFAWSEPTWSTEVSTGAPFSQPPREWDYATPLSISSKVTWDPERLQGLSLQTLRLVLVVECPSTSMRWVESAPLAVDAMHQTAVTTVPAGEASRALEVRSWIVCESGDPELDIPVAAKIAWTERHRMDLEGDGGRFPTQSVDFRDLRLPPRAAWTVTVEATDLDQSFGSSVRVLINASHPAHDLLLDLERPAAGIALEVLRKDIISTVLGEIAADSLLEHSFDPTFTDSLGAVLNHWCELYLNMDLPSALSLLLQDRTRFEVELQAGMLFLSSGGA